MEAQQLFTGLLLAVGAIHLIFSVKEAISGWMEQNQHDHSVMAKGKSKPIHFDWYVFFDPADLIGRQPQSKSVKPQQQKSVNQRPRTSSSRPRARL